MKKHLKVSCHDEIAFKFSSHVKAILLSEIMFWNESKMKTAALKYGLPLVYFSSNAINKKFKSINANTANRLLKQLTTDGILFSCIANSMQRDTTKSYLVNFAYYDAILNDVEYPQIEKDRFTTIAQNAVNTIDKNSKLLCNEILKFLVIQNEYPKIKNGLEIQNESLEIQNESLEIQNESLEIQNESLEIQNESLEIQNESTLPSNTPSNKTSNTFSKLINLKTLKSDKTVLAENTKNTVFSKEQLKVIDYVKSIFKYYRITTHKDCNQDIALLIGYLQNELENHDANFSLDRKPTITNIYDLMENLIVEIWGRIKESETKKQNFKFFDTCIRNEYKTEMIDQYLCKQQQQNKK
jgi:hypothetical protein